MRIALLVALTIVVLWRTPASMAQEPPLALPVVLEPEPLEFIIPVSLPPPRPKVWSGGAEFGLNGAEGNSQLFRTRFGANAKYDTPAYVWTGNLAYNFTTSAGIRSENRLLANDRLERNFFGTSCLAFVSGSVEYDEFRAFDLLLTTHAGFGYHFLRTDVTTLKGRAGFGGSQTVNGPDDRFIPEALTGLDFEHKFTPRNKLVASLTAFPEVTDIRQFRSEATTAYECLLSEINNLSLKIGATDRYFSRPQGRKPNDLDYFATLLWKF